MKKIITIFLLIISLSSFSQSNTSNIILTNIKDVIPTEQIINKSLTKINDIESLFVHYFKEATESSKGLFTSTLNIAEKAVTMLLEQSEIIVRQYVIFTSIEYLLPILLGIFILFLPKVLTNNFAIDKEKAIAHNKEYEKRDSYFTSLKIMPKFFNNYYESSDTLIMVTAAKIGLYISSIVLITNNFLPFIKITFFTKLYFVELLMKNI